MMHWFKTSIFSILGGITLGVIVDLALHSSGESAITSAGVAIVLGVPIGSVLSAGFYRGLVLKSATKTLILGGFLGLILSGFGALSGLFTMDLIGGYFGLGTALVLSTVGCVCGYEAIPKIIEFTALK